jgi:phosphoribosylformimino-5-aminoimidazole carboxamide ribotide isomerase
MEIIPAIDLINGQCVRLYQGDFSRASIYHDHPLEQAIQFQEQGFQRLHVVDLDGAKSGSPKHLAVLTEICANTRMKVDFGGGIRTRDHVRKIQDAGAVMCSIGSLAVKDPDTFLKIRDEFGSDFIFLGLDVRDRQLVTGGWQEQTSKTIFDWLSDDRFAGIDHIFCTDVTRDGTLTGSSISLYQDLLDQFPHLRLTASGGISSVTELIQLKEMGMNGAIIGKALYEGSITPHQLQEKQIL